MKRLALKPYSYIAATTAASIRDQKVNSLSSSQSLSSKQGGAWKNAGIATGEMMGNAGQCRIPAPCYSQGTCFVMGQLVIPPS